MVNKRKRREVVRVMASAQEGLSVAQVQERELAHQTNHNGAQSSSSYRTIFAKNLLTYFNLISFLMAAALIVVGAYSDILFLGIVFSNLAIGTFQEIQAKRTLDRLSLVATPKVKVVREGVECAVATEAVVLDDVMVLSQGQQIVADAVVSEGNAEVNEALLTGESKPVRKQKGDSVLAGSFITSGKIYARVDRVGEQNYVQQLAREAQAMKANPSELLRSIRWIIRTIGFSLLPMGALLYFNNYQATLDVQDAVSRTAGSLIMMIPSGMVLLTSVALAVGIIRLASHQTLVKDLYSIEMLARSDVLCLDKTGTITDGTMRLKELHVMPPHDTQEVQQALRSLLLAQPQQNDTAEAVLEALSALPLPPWSATQIVPFSSERKRSAAAFAQRGTYIMGASEFVFQTLPIEQQAELDQWTRAGYRVLVVGYTQESLNDHHIPFAQTLLAIVIIEDHIRDDAPAIIEWFQTNGVAIKIISGDHPQAVASIAARAKVPHADAFINLEGKTLEEVAQLAHQYTIFGRVTPEQKKQLIQSYRGQGHTVAMTGDGVNDILAFKEADCSIAMASGSEAARGVANLVLLDSNFSSLPKVVFEGRRVVNNIEKSSSLFLMKTIFTILLSLLVMVLQIPYPITPSNLILFEFCVIGAPSLLLVIQPNTSVIRGHFLQTVFRKALPYALVFLLNAILVIGISAWLGLTLYRDDMVIYTMTYIGFIALCFLSWPLNRFRTWMLAGSLMIISLGFWILPHVSLGGDPILDFLPLETPVIGLTLGLIALSIPSLLLLKKVVERWLPHS